MRACVCVFARVVVCGGDARVREGRATTTGRDILKIDAIARRRGERASGGEGGEGGDDAVRSVVVV